MPDRDLRTVREAAEALGVSPQRIRQLIATGGLPAHHTSAGWLVPSAAIDDRAESSPHGRPTGSRTVWALISLLAAADASGDLLRPAGPGGATMDRRLRHRVAKQIRDLPDPRVDSRPWRRLLSGRGASRVMWVHPGVLPRLLDDERIRIGGQPPATPGDALSGGSRTVVYVSTSDVETVVQDFRLRDDPSGHLTLIAAPPGLFEEHPGDRRVPVPAALADLLDEHDPRAHDLAARHLGELHDAFTRTDGAPR